MSLRSLTRPAGLLLGIALSVACSSDPQTDCGDDRCDQADPAKAACLSKVLDGSGLGRDPQAIVANNDQFARLVLLEGDGCPTDASDVMAKLNRVPGCSSDSNGTAIVNELSSHAALREDKPDAKLVDLAQGSNRAVISRRCVPSAPGQPASDKPCIGLDVAEVDFLVDACGETTNTPVCFEQNGGPSVFQTKACVRCVTRDDGKLGKDDLRTAAARCLDRDAKPLPVAPPFNLLFSVFAGMNEIGEDGMEVIALDDASGVFNYYKETNGAWSFMGNSTDFHRGEGGFCKGCHPGGGLVQKELATPWMNWEVSGDVPHVGKLIAGNTEFFGGILPLGGEGLDTNIIRPGNRLMNARRVDRLTARVAAAKGERGGSREVFENDASPVFTQPQLISLLKPLFCTTEINFAFGTFGNEGIFVPDLTLSLAAFDSINLPNSEYDAAIAELGQVRGTGALTSPDSSQPLARPTGGAVFDSFEGIYPQMVSADLLTDEFILDLHMVDFTRPLFSDARCQLLEFTPTITVGDLERAKTLGKAIADGFVKKLTAATGKSPAATAFLANLKDGGEAKRTAALQQFTDACTARAEAEPRAFMIDVVKMVELMRQETERRLEIIEPFLRDDVWPSIPGMASDFSRWNPTTCQLE